MDRRIGAQYFTIRDYIQTIEDFDASCKKISDIGYKIVQISGTPLKAKEMREVLDKYNLQAVTSHRSFDDFKNNLDEVIDYNKTLGIELCGIGAMPWENFEDLDKIKKFIKDANEICKVLRSENMYFGYHNHAAEFEKFNGRSVMDMLLTETDPEIFNFIADTYWLHYAGNDVSDVISRMGKRAMAVHFKDINVKRGTNVATMYEIGEGNLNWSKIIETCANVGVKWVLVEQDECERDPFEALKMSYDFLTERGFY